MRVWRYNETKNKGGYIMKNHNNTMLAKAMKKTAEHMLSVTANSRCVAVFHQPKQPNDVKKFRKF